MTRQKIRDAHLNRERHETETKNRSENMKKVSEMRKTSPYCQKQSPPSAAKRWHFENCLQNPNLSSEKRKELEVEREILRQKAILRNTSRLQSKNEKE